MSANDYIAAVKSRNPKLFATATTSIRTTAATFEEQIRLAFEAGDRAGAEREREAKSLFDSLFGKLGH